MFTDVKGRWSEKFVEYAARWGFLNGYPDGSFKPKQPITREEFAAFIYRSTFPTWGNIVEKVLPSVVYINSGGEHGTGVIIGYKTILTAAHVADGYLTVRLRDGREYPAKLFKKHPSADLAIIKFGCDDELPVVPLATEWKLGEEITTIGHPGRQDWAVTGGFINDNGRKSYEFQMQLFADHGNSGGPILNQNGEIVGVLVRNERDNILTVATDVVKLKSWIEDNAE